MQVLQHQPVLRQRPLLPYVPLLGAGSASVPAMKILNGEVFSVVIRDLQEPVTIYLGNRRKAEHGILERFAAAY